MTRQEWTAYRNSFREAAQKEITDAIDAGQGALPINILLTDLVLRDLYDRVSALEGKKRKRVGDTTSTGGLNGGNDRS